MKCALCDRDFPVEEMIRRFTGRPKYICIECESTGSRQIDARNKDFFSTATGQKLLERKRKEF